MDSSLRFDQTSDSEKSLVPEILDLVKDLSREAEHLLMQLLGVRDSYTGAGGDFQEIHVGCERAQGGQKGQNDIVPAAPPDNIGNWQSLRELAGSLAGEA
jgi:hypothetical protein